MDEYISREALLAEIAADYGNWIVCNDTDESYRQGVKDNYSDTIRLINDIPAADMQPVNQWISVKERLPEIGKSVLIYYPKWDGDEIQVAKLDCDGITFDICGEFNIGTGVITHWMPLPEPPKDGDAE